MLCNEIKQPTPFAIVITRMLQGDRLPEFPWLDQRYAMGESDWIVLPPEDWRALVAGEEPLWEALQRKLLLAYYLHQPELITVVGHPDGQEDADAAEAGPQGVQQIVHRIRDCNLPAEVLGFWADPAGDTGHLVAPTPEEREAQYAIWY